MTETHAPVAPDPAAAIFPSTAHRITTLPKNLKRFLLQDKVVVVTGFVFIPSIIGFSSADGASF